MNKLYTNHISARDNNFITSMSDLSIYQEDTINIDLKITLLPHQMLILPADWSDKFELNNKLERVMDLDVR